MPSRFRFALSLALLITAIGLESAQGGLRDAHSWQHVSDDGQFVLVMIAPKPVEKDAVVHPAYDTEGIRRLRATYSHSGLYRNDGSTQPVWKTSFAMDSKVFLTADGQHLVLADEHPGRNHGHLASFYASGQLLRRYSFGDLIQSRLQAKIWELRSGTDFTSQRLSDNEQTFTIATNHGETFVFDITTGKMIRSSSRYPLYMGAVAVILVSLTAMGLVFFVRRRKLSS